MSDDRALLFKERAYQNYKDEIATLKVVVEKLQTEDLEEIEEYREPLSMEEYKEITILLSWGGPSDGFKVWIDCEGDVVEGYYFFADWFEYREMKLTSEELDMVQRIYYVGERY